MSDEIDIEEHDVMDNPSIKRIFPDITVIKKEINQYYDEGFNALPDTTLEESSQEAVITDDPTSLLPTHLHDIDRSSSNNGPEATGIPKETRYLHDNLIMLGSKPSLGWEKNKHNCNSVTKQEPKLILQNVSPFLDRCKRYCKSCLILFPKSNVLSLHMINVHSRKNNYGTTKPKNFLKRKLSNKLFKCYTCNMTLSSRSNLIRHFRNLHGNGKTNRTLMKSDEIEVSNKVSKTEKSTGLACFHCKLLFSSQSSLIEHLYQVLDPVTGANNSATPKESQKKGNDRVIKEECVKENDISQNIECTKCKLEFCSQEKYDEHVGDHHHHSDHNLTLNKNNKIKFAKSVIDDAQRLGDDINKKNKMFAIRNNAQGVFKSKTLSLKTNCSICSQHFKSHGELEYHIRSVHRTKTRYINKNKISKMKKSSMKSPNTFYKCFVCSKYNITFEFYSRHIVTDHNIKEVTTVEKVPFDSNCELCSSKMSDFKSYNAHLYKYHKMKLREAIFPPDEQKDNKDPEALSKDIQCALKSTLFKCTKCDFFFLSSNTAMEHINHSKMLKNWECPVCQRIFKKEDKDLHVKQHLFSRTFNVHALSESEFRRVLYKCSNCTVHYSEESFLLHYQKCDSETPCSLYCRICDVLINKDDMDSHELNHKDKDNNCFDFIIIESDIIDKKQSRTNKIKIKSNKIKKDTCKRNNQITQNLQESSKLVMNFCHTCKCFVSNINFTRNVHIEARCSHMLKTICKECGLILTMKTHATHKGIHKEKQLNLQDYSFFDLKTKKQICPPIPEYPKCNMCGVHFLRNFAIKIHSCQDQDYITCDICSIKLTEHAYKLHMSFHNYSIQNVNAKIKDTDSELRLTNDLSCMDSNSPVLDDITTADVILFYTCKGCQITVNTYDRVVQHCQDHYDCKKVQLDIEKCQNCNLIFDRGDYESHNKLHLKGKFNNSLTVDFDPFYFRFNNDFWTKHIFAYVADEQIGKILHNSMYKYECRLKMEELQPGSLSLVLYKCEKCLSFIDPHSLYMHVKNARDKSCVKLRTFPCTSCGLCFGSINYRIFHEKEHKCIDINLKAYKIVSFNKMEHETFNSIMFEACNKFTLYQCRNCYQVIDKFQRKDHKCDVDNLKICVTCGLLLQRQDYDLHFIRHEELETFNAENITIVMFGKKSDARKKELRSTFSGTKYDHTIYKCKNCDLCLRTKMCISKHVCVSDESKLKCPKCGLYFLKSELKYHCKLHESDLEFDEFNREIITFDGSPASLEVAPKETLRANPEFLREPIDEVNGQSFDKEITKDCSKKLEKIYKCDCGLHFLEELNALQHSNNCNIRMKISKQSCFKCDLLFTPGELFNHLLKHHCDKKIQYKFDIVFVSKKETIT